MQRARNRISPHYARSKTEEQTPYPARSFRRPGPNIWRRTAQGSTIRYIRGITRDSVGAILPEANCVLHQHTSHRLAGETISDSNGFFEFIVHDALEYYVTSWKVLGITITGASVFLLGD